MRFFELSESMFGLFFTWALVIFVLCAWNFLNSFRQKRKKYIWLSAAVFFITYIVIQIMLDIKYMREGKKSTVIADFMGYLPVESWAVYIALCMIASVIITVYYMHWKKENITVMSIKDSIDTLQAGLCYWKDGGQVILSNRKMNDLCFDITGEALLNGELFFEAIDKECIEMSDGTIRSFKHKILDYKDGHIHELVATDVTEIYKKNEMYARETEALRKMNESLRRYNHDIEEIVRMQEILQAKMYIHDEMNKLMLYTSVKTDSYVNDEEFESIMTVWRNNAMLLGNEAVHHDADTDMASIYEIAKMLAINVKLSGDSMQLLSENNRKILIIASREAIANAVKHAAAKELTINISTDNDMEKITISNDGDIPNHDIREGGGLSNIRMMVEGAGGELAVYTDERFNIVLSFPRGRETSHMEGENL